MTACSTCPGTEYCYRCPTCDRCTDCECMPPVQVAGMTAHLLGRCEGCGRAIREGEKYHLWDDGPVTHVECPQGAKA